MTPYQALGLQITSDVGDVTLRQFLCELLQTMWHEGDNFSAKRLFGNGGWDLNVYAVLITAGALPGKLDSDGCVEDLDVRAASLFVESMIQAMCEPSVTKDWVLPLSPTPEQLEQLQAMISKYVHDRDRLTESPKCSTD